MLPAQHRFTLRRSPSFFSTARRVFSPFITVWYQLHPEGNFQAAFIVSKKNYKLSADRHRVLRQLRAGVAAFIKVQPTLPELQVVIMPTRQAITLTFHELQTEVQSVLSKLPQK